MGRIGLWVRIFLSVHHIVTSTYVCNMAEGKGRFKPCLSVLFVLDQLAMDSKTTREWLSHQYCSRTSRRTHASLSPDHENEIRGLHGDIAIVVLVFFLLEVWSIFRAASSLVDIFKLHRREQTVSMVTAEFPVLMRVRACNMLFILVPRGCDPFGQRHGSRPLATQRSNTCACLSHARAIWARVGMGYTISIETNERQNGGRFKFRGVCLHFPGIRRKQNS